MIRALLEDAFELACLAALLVLIYVAAIAAG